MVQSPSARRKWVLFESKKEDKSAKGKRRAPDFIYYTQDKQASNFHFPYSHKATENL